MADMDAEYRQILKTELENRKARNKRLSLRSFAKFLDVDTSYLSKLNAGKIILSPKLAASFAHKLCLDEARRKIFILSAAEEQKCHALYLVDPSLTDCDSSFDDRNKAPKTRSRKAR